MKHLRIYINILTISLLILSAHLTSCGQNKEEKYKVLCVSFYNIENLFDTIDSPNTNDFEFTPEGFNKWNSEKYYHKLEQISKVIAGIGTESTPDGPAILGLSEIENIEVLKDLVQMPLLKSREYRIVHYDSPDRRGVDVALLYSAYYFNLKSSSSHFLSIPGEPDFRTRDQLLVSGELDGEMMHFIVNHWPSRSGGEKKSRPLRNAAADLSRSIIDSLLSIDPNTRIILMGDLNDDPVDPSVKEHLRARGEISDMGQGDLYNPMYSLYKKGIGSLAWRDSWNLFDQLIISKGLTGDDFSKYKFYRAKVYNQPFMRQDSGPFKGYPFRTFAGGTWHGGFSDHFPVYLFLIKKAD